MTYEEIKIKLKDMGAYRIGKAQWRLHDWFIRPLNRKKQVVSYSERPMSVVEFFNKYYKWYRGARND